jgi:hypothetical protein
MLVYTPNERITARNVLRHEYFNDLDRRSLPEPVVDDDL